MQVSLMEALCHLDWPTLYNNGNSPEHVNVVVGECDERIFFVKMGE
jgi:hypothetical protein